MVHPLGLKRTLASLHAALASWKEHWVNNYFFPLTVVTMIAYSWRPLWIVAHMAAHTVAGLERRGSTFQ